MTQTLKAQIIMLPPLEWPKILGFYSVSPLLSIGWLNFRWFPRKGEMG
ncbi:Neurobeachin [Corchorus olitorius]|uniref:Neurobeachin n=1 Tax=Corchorus olitorius TaxID=93759 RepID=A0A1R3H2P3_9ROSI|nr:Neurobeachin [Corchorus olitorius]